MFFGRVSVMALALGTSPEREHMPGLSKLSNQLKGQVGLFFTSWDVTETLDYFHSIRKPEFARAGCVATETFTIPSGGPLSPVLLKEDEAAGIEKSTPFPSAMEPQLRKLGLSTRLEKGSIMMATDQTVCKAGDRLTSEQAQILKLMGVKMSVFRVALRWMWDKETEAVKEYDAPLEDAGEVEEGEDDDEEMDE